MEIKFNSSWESANIVFSIVTPVFNRPKELKRAIHSVENLDYKDFEYIIVNDGSTENIDEIITQFMENTTIPVCYIKKENGGVHTARNEATRHCRGKYKINLDSDDELLPNALSVFLRAWESIPAEKKSDYREVVALCQNSKGELLGEKFPKNINNLTWDKALKLCRKCKGEHIGCNRTEIAKAYMFPEPVGVTFVAEGIIWNQLYKKYKSFFINDVVRVYHNETEASYTNASKKDLSPQQLINGAWNSTFVINNYNYSDYSFEFLIKNFIKRNAFILLYKKNTGKTINADLVKLKKKQYLAGLLWLPSIFIAIMFLKGNRNPLITRFLR